jgi:hypothetical protein
MTGAIEEGLGALTVDVHAGGVAELLAHGPIDGVGHRRIDWRGGIVVEVSTHEIDRSTAPNHQQEKG